MTSFLGKLLIGVGVVLIVSGAIFLWFPKISFFGKLPGDIRIEKGDFSFYFPITTCLAVSIIFSLVAWLLSRR